jgi:hypothetical protein
MKILIQQNIDDVCLTELRIQCFYEWELTHAETECKAIVQKWTTEASVLKKKSRN